MIIVEDRASEWVGAQLGVEIVPPFTAAGIYDDTGQIGGVVFNDYNGSNIELTAAGNGAFSPEIAVWIASYVFNQLDCQRMTIRTKPENKPALLSAMRWGWKTEGYQADYYTDGDAVILGLQRRDLPKWIQKALDNEITKDTCSA